MPRGDKSAYTGKQQRKAEHIEEGYEKRGVPATEAARRAWATVNKEDHGGKKSGSGRGKATDKSPSKKGGVIGGHAPKGKITTTSASKTVKKTSVKRKAASSRSK